MTSVFRRSLERAYGYNLSLSNRHENVDGTIEKSPRVPMRKVLGDIIQFATYFPPFSVGIGIPGAVIEITKLIKSKDNKSRLLHGAYLSRHCLCAVGLGIAALPFDITATVTRKVRLYKMRKNA